MLGRGVGLSLEIGCGTGIHAARIRGLGWSPFGIDLSAGMLRPLAPGFRSLRPMVSVCHSGTLHSVGVVAVMIHTDAANYSAVLREAWRVLAPGGCFVMSGSPMLLRGFADRTDPEAPFSVPAISIVIGRRRHGPKGALGTRLVQRTWPCRLCSARLLKPDLCSKASGKVEPIPTVLAVRTLKPSEETPAIRDQISPSRRIGQALVRMVTEDSEVSRYQGVSLWFRAPGCDW